MPRVKGRHRKPRPPIVPTAALAGTSVAALVITVTSGGGAPQAGFVDAHTNPYTIDPSPTAAASIPGAGEQSAGSDHAARDSVRVAQAKPAGDDSAGGSASSGGSGPTGSQGSQGSGSESEQPPADDTTGPLPGTDPVPSTSPSPSPTEKNPLPKVPDLPLPDVPDLPGVSVQVGIG